MDKQERLVEEMKQRAMEAENEAAKMAQAIKKAKAQDLKDQLKHQLDGLHDAAIRFQKAVQGLGKAGSGMSALADFAYRTAEENEDLRDKVQRLESLVLDLVRRLDNVTS